MKKKALAIVLAASMLMMTACSTAKETTESSGFVTEATTTATTESITTDSTAATTVSDNQPGEEVIISLFPEEKREQIYQMDPMELIKFSQFYQMFNIHGSGKMDQGEGGIELLTNDYLSVQLIVLLVLGNILLVGSLNLVGLDDSSASLCNAAVDACANACKDSNTQCGTFL